MTGEHYLDDLLRGRAHRKRLEKPVPVEISDV